MKDLIQQNVLSTYPPREPIAQPELTQPSRSQEPCSVGPININGHASMSKNKISQDPTVLNSLYAVVRSSWLNLFLVFMPVTFTIRSTNNDPYQLFIFSFLTLLSLAKILGYCTTEASYRLRPLSANFLRVFCGQIIEFSFGVVCIIKCQIIVLQSSLVGSILMNLLLGVGATCIGFGYSRTESKLSEMQGGLSIHLLTLSTVCMLLPTTFAAFLGDNSSLQEYEQERWSVLGVSRMGSVMMLFLYSVYLIVQFRASSVLSLRYIKLPSTDEDNTDMAIEVGPNYSSKNSTLSDVEALTSFDNADISSHLSFWIIPPIFLITTALIVVFSTYFVSSLSVLIERNFFKTPQWVGLVLFPYIGSLSRHNPVESAIYGYTNKFNDSMALNLDSSVNMALFIQPVLIILSWVLHKNLTLLYDPFLILMLFICVNAASFAIVHTKCSLAPGVALISLYSFTVTMFWFYPGSSVFTNLLWSC